MMSSKEQKDRDEKVLWKFQLDTILKRKGFFQPNATDIAKFTDFREIIEAIERKDERLFCAFNWKNVQGDHVCYIIPESSQQRPYIHYSTIGYEKELLNKDGRS